MDRKESPWDDPLRRPATRTSGGRGVGELLAEEIRAVYALA